jgi:hypothetical protein
METDEVPDMTEIPKPKETAIQSPEDRQHSLERKRFTVEKATLFFLFLYVTIAAFQWCEMRKSTNATTRAWIGLSAFNVGEYHQGVPLLGPINPDVPLNTNIVLENFGKTPADIDEIGFAYEVRLNQVPEDFQYRNAKRGPTMFPSQKTQTVNSDIISIPLSDYELVRKQTKRLVLHGIVGYHDMFGSHETKFCLIWSGDGKNFINCLEHNSAN